MPNIRIETAVASAGVGTDLLQNDVLNRQPGWRRLTNLALTGSAAAGDTVVELLINGKAIGKFSNTSTGKVADRQKDFRAVNVGVKANELVQLFVRTAPGTNPIVTEMEFTEGSGGAFRRSGSGGSYARKSYGTRRTSRTSSSRGGMY